MATITQRYSTAVHARSLKVDPRTSMADPDVLAAMGWADKTLTEGRDRQGNPVRPAPLAVSLERLFSGDNTAAHAIVRTLAELAFEQSWVMKIKISRPAAHDMACACLAWHRNGVCRACGGHGLTLIPGTKTHSEHGCQPCRGSGKVLFDQQFRQDHQQLARWLVSEMERAAGRAGPIAMRHLADDMEL